MGTTLACSRLIIARGLIHRVARIAVISLSVGFLLSGAAVRAAVPIETYGQLPGVEFVRLSPSGERVALIGVVGEQRRVLILGAGGALLRTGAVGDAKVRDLQWAGEDTVLVTVSALANLQLDFRQNYELSNVIRIGVTDNKAWAVFENSRAIAHTVSAYYGAAVVGGHWYGYFGGITLVRRGSEYLFDHGYADLYRVDLASGDASLETKGDKRERDWAVDSDGAVVAHADYNRDTGAWRLFAGVKSREPFFSKTSPTNDVMLLGLGRSSSTALVLDTSGDEDLLEEFDIATGKPEALWGDREITDYLFDPVTRFLIGAATADERGAIFFDPLLQQRSDATHKAFPSLQVHLISHSQGLNKLVVKTDGKDDAGTYWLVDVASGKADPLGYEYPTIKPADVAATSVVSYRASDGLPMQGILTLPVGREAKALPLVVLPHGGPIGVVDRVGFDWWAQGLASRGYAVFQPNYRGSGGAGVEFRRAGFGQWGRKMLSDIADGVVALTTQQIVDPKRVCIVGASYGGYAALAGVTLQHGLYRCAVSVAGPADLSSFGVWQASRYGYVSDSSRYWRRVTGADVEGERLLRAISPSSFAERADAPILLIHGKDDTRVPIEQSEEMASALKNAHKPYEFVTLPREDHFLSRQVTRTVMLTTTVKFLETYNPPD